MKISNIDQFKKIKLAKKVVKDITFLMNIIRLTLRAFKRYEKYTPIKELIRVIEDQKQILQIHLDSNKNAIEEYEQKS